MRAAINDLLRDLLGLSIHGLGAVCHGIHSVRLASFVRAQQRLRRRYGIEPGTPILAYGPEVEQGIRRAALRRRGARWAETSGSTAAPKRILYTRRRLLEARWTFIDAFARAFRAYGKHRRASLYVFRPFDNDHSLTSMLVEESRAPSFLATLQAPYRVESHPEFRALAERYGASAVRLWILVIANPGVLYSTNPSTLWLFLHDVETDWERTRQMVVAFHRDGRSLGAAIPSIVRRLMSVGASERIERIVSSERPLPLSAIAPAVHMVVCWTGGYVRPFLDRLTRYLSPERYRFVPMYSMSTETVETILHCGSNGESFLPLAPRVLYEFIEDGVPDWPENLKAPHELEPGKAYAMVVSDPFGLRRYQSDDVFFCAGVARGLPDLRFLGRRNLEYSFTGEKLSSIQLGAVFERLRRSAPAVAAAAFLTCFPSRPAGDDLPHYKIALVGSDATDCDSDEGIARDCDRLIQEENHEYRHKRETGRLGPVQLLRIPAIDFVARFGSLSSVVDGQFKFLPLYRRLWEELPGQPPGMFGENRIVGKLCG